LRHGASPVAWILLDALVPAAGIVDAQPLDAGHERRR
jgi:hypothetical protein